MTKLGGKIPTSCDKWPQRGQLCHRPLVFIIPKHSLASPLFTSIPGARRWPRGVEGGKFQAPGLSVWSSIWKTLLAQQGFVPSAWQGVGDPVSLWVWQGTLVCGGRRSLAASGGWNWGWNPQAFAAAKLPRGASRDGQLENPQLENHWIPLLPVLQFPCFGVCFPFVQLFPVEQKAQQNGAPSFHTSLSFFLGVFLYKILSLALRTHEGFGAQHEDYQILVVLKQITAVTQYWCSLVWFYGIQSRMN